MENTHSYPSREELLVNDVLMKKCNHAMHVAKLETTRDRLYGHVYIRSNIVFTCTKCGLTDTETIEPNYSALKEDEIEEIDISRPDGYLQFKVNKWLSDKIMEEAVLREIKKQGWENKIVSKNKRYQCVVTNDGRNVKGELSRNELDAIASCLYELARVLLHQSKNIS